MPTAVLAERLVCRYGSRVVVREVSFSAEAGSLTALLGPNGAGKSTLLRALIGLGEWSGRVELLGAPVASLSRRDIARRAALVAQEAPAEMPFSVEELVLMGRAPFLGPLAVEGPEDRAIAAEALRATGISNLAQRPIDALSGGERRRAYLARALAQKPRVLLLDEPTAFLDLAHQAEILEQAHRLAESGLCVVAVLHDPNLASAWADRVALMRDGAIVAAGPTREVLDARALSALYDTHLVETPPCREAAGGRLFALARGAAAGHRED